MFKKLLATAATMLLAAGLSVVAVAAPASATNPVVTGSYVCNPVTGKFDITWRVTGDTGHAGETATIKSQSQATTPTLINLTVKGAGYVEGVQSNVTVNTNYKQTVSVQWTNHATGDLVTANSNNVKVPAGSTCVIPPPTQVDSVDCSVIKYVRGSPLDGTDYINATFIQPGKGSFQMNLEINEVQAQDAAVDGPTHLYVLIHTPNGDVKYPLTVAERDSGILTYTYSTYLTGTWTVDWIQYASHNEHFEGELVCGTPTPDAAAAITKTDATCQAAQTLTLGTVTNATWGTPVYSGNGNLDYSVVATATANHKFPAGEGVTDGTTKTFKGTLNPKLTGDELCPPEQPKCLPKSQVSYTYFPWSNGGTITVTALPGYSDELCDDFYVTVATWTYDKNDNQWPQTLKETQNLHIDKVGPYPYGLNVTCGQGDVYASFTSQPVPPGYLTAPGKPFEPGFLHNMGFTGPAPTYTQTKPGCNVVTPATPVVKVIETCGQYGSVVADDTDQFDYTITGSNGQGTYTVTAAVKPGYILAEGAKTAWEYNLGTYVECVETCDTFTDGPVSTNLDHAGWVFEVGANGSYQYVDGGLKVVTTSATSAGKSAGLIPTNFPLSSAGAPSLDFTNNTPGSAEPGINMVLTIDKNDGNGPQWFGTLVNEPLFPYWWINKVVPGVDPGLNPSYQKAAGTLDEFVFAFAQLGWTVNVTQVGYSLGSNAIGDNTIHSLTANCVEYTFDNLNVEPKVTVNFGACYPNGDFSSKNVYFTFDNSLSDVDVTFTIPAAGVTQLVAKHSIVADVEVAPIWHHGGSYDVYVDGVLLKNVVLPPFDQCQEDIVPGDPKDSPEICTNGVISQGYIWVDLLPGKLEYTIHDVAKNTDIVVTEAKTYLDAGDYIVSVVGINGFTVKLPDTWTHNITIGSPENCDVIEVPVLADPTPIVCSTGEGSYVLPKTEYIDWYVNGNKVPDNAPEKTVVTEAGTVDIEAKINTDGIFFPKDAVTTWKFTFVEPDDCIEPTLTGSTAVGTCAANAPFIQYSVKLNDPDNQSSTRDAYLVLTDPNDASVTETIFLGTIDSSGLLEGKVLWPGASVAPDGVTATGWPGWEQDIEGNWVETTGNFAWTRDVTQAVIEVNPSIAVALEYPDATPLCDNPPELPPLATVTPTFASSTLSCTVAGSYTLGELDPGTITWTVTGPGNPSSTIGQHAVTTPGKYTFVATPTDPEDGLDPDWPYNEENPLTVTFSLPAAGCDVKTLALTGVAGIGGVTLIGGLLVIGGIAFFFLRRRTAE